MNGLPSPGPTGKSAKICLERSSTGTTLEGWSGIFFSSFCRGVRCVQERFEDWAAYHVVKDTLVELPLGRAALPQLVVVVVEALPVLAELGEAVGVDVLDAVSVFISSCMRRSGCRLSRCMGSHGTGCAAHQDAIGTGSTYTLWAQRVTRRPSFMQSNSPRPGFSVLHCM